MNKTPNIFKNTNNVLIRKRLRHIYFLAYNASLLVFVLLGICLLSLSLTVGVQARNTNSSTSSIISTNGYNLGFSTYLGQNSFDQGNAITTDSNGNSYVTGQTSSSTFPMKNAYNSTYGGGGDIFITKFDSIGNLVFSTYFGGNSDDRGRAIAVDTSGNIYITGNTLSVNFPTMNAYNATPGGSNDVFVAKFSPTGVLVFSTYLGGSGIDIGRGIAVDSNGNCYVTGYTLSSNFPTKNAYNTTFGGGDDIFIAKYDSTGALVFSTYLGGTGVDDGYGIAVDPSGNYYITGITGSTNFPTKNAYNATYGGGIDIFLTKFNTTNALVFSTYLGGSNSETGFGLAVDSNGNSYITGSTFSSNFPMKNAYNATFGGNFDTFVAKFDTTGILTFSTYFGGSNSETGYAIAVDSSANFYITGNTYSTNFPMKNAYNTTFDGVYYDAFVAKFNATNTLVFSTYLGGSRDEFSYGVATDGNGNSYVTGVTSSSNFPVINGYYTAYSGNSDAFVTKFTSPTNISGSTSTSTSASSISSSTTSASSSPLLDTSLFTNPVFDIMAILFFFSILGNLITIFRRK